MTPRSMKVPAFQAAITPIGTAAQIAITSVVVVSISVGSRRWSISLETGRFEKIETPRSPRARLKTHLPNWTRKGSLRPRRSRMRAMSSAVARSPAMIAAGSPGLRNSSEKTKIATTAMTGMVARIRRIK